MENAVGKYPGQEMSPQKIIKSLMGSPDNPGSNENAAPILNHLRDNVFGANSPEWNTIQRAVVSHLTEAAPGAEPVPFAKQAQRIDKFLGNQRHAGALFDQAQQDRFQAHADTLRGAEPEALPAAGTIERKIAQLSGRLTGEPGSGAKLLSELSGDRGGDLATELKQRLSPENLGRLKQNFFQQMSEAPEGMMPWEHQKTGQRIAAFLNTPAAQQLYSPGERMVMKAIADAHLAIVPIPGSTNVSGSAYTGAAIAKNAAKQLTRYLFRMIGFAHGGIGGVIAGELGARAREAAMTPIMARRAAQRAEQLFLGRRSAPPVGARAGQKFGALAAPALTYRNQEQ
jgi:hypothetical protein